MLANAGQFDKAMDWVSWAVAHDYKDFFWVKGRRRAGSYYLTGRYEEALQVLKGVEATHSWPIDGDLRSSRAASMRRRAVARAEWAQDWTPLGPSRRPACRSASR